jgi:uridine phosphorylase
MSYPKFKNKHLHETLVSPEKSPHFMRKMPKKMPKKAIIFYNAFLLRKVLEKYKPKKMKRVSSQFDFFKYRDITFLYCIGVGSPSAALVLEEAISMGIRKFLNIGYAGGLQHDGFFLCDKALRDEGTSYHYLPHGSFVFPDKELNESLGKAMKDSGLEFEKGTTWTIDAPYRETKKEVEHYRKKGIMTVEMETSALFAVAKLRKVKIASAFSVSDVLGKKWEPKFHHKKTKDLLMTLFDAAVLCLSREK